MDDTEAASATLLHEYRGLHSDYFLAPADSSVPAIPTVVQFHILSILTALGHQFCVGIPFCTVGLTADRGCHIRRSR
jgi:hypothetical protein